jgi:arabinan endo-1,5-alpha-L-arabinosidase
MPINTWHQALLGAAWLAASAAALAAPPAAGHYRNPLPLLLPGGGVAQTCADPVLLAPQPPRELQWTLYCTSDPLHEGDRNAQGGLNFRKLPMFQSPDLVNWVYRGDAFPAQPAGATATAGIWAPEVVYRDGQYRMYFVITDVVDALSPAPGCDNDSAIAVATAPGATGPWTVSPHLVVPPQPASARAGKPCQFHWTFDPDVLRAQDGRDYLYYGSYDGGIFVQPLAADGLSGEGAATRITTASRYEAAEVVFKDGHYVLFVSAANCCNGALTGYALFAGRASSPTGPFVDQQGQSLLSSRVGGTPVITQNGNRWVGAGHNTVFEDRAGQWWTIYHAVDRHDAHLGGPGGVTKRPALLDRIDWVGGWPVLNGGAGPSDTPQPAPQLRADAQPTGHPAPVPDVALGRTAWADDFSGRQLHNRWSWVRPPSAPGYGVARGELHIDTQAADLYGDRNDAAVLTAPLPRGSYVVETRVKLNVPAEGCCFNHVQAGLVVYGDDDHYLKLVHVAIDDTRQTEFAVEVGTGRAGQPRYGNTVVGAPAGPGAWTGLRIVAQQRGGQTHYTAYTRQDSKAWVRGGTWTHQPGRDERLGLVAMGGAGFRASFDHVRVYRLR